MENKPDTFFEKDRQKSLQLPVSSWAGYYRLMRTNAEYPDTEDGELLAFWQQQTGLLEGCLKP